MHTFSSPRIPRLMHAANDRNVSINRTLEKLVRHVALTGLTDGTQMDTVGDNSGRPLVGSAIGAMIKIVYSSVREPPTKVAQVS